MSLGSLRMPKTSLHGDQVDTCAFPGCFSRIEARGWCGTHYRNFLYHGGPGTQLTLRQAIESLPDEAWDLRPPPKPRPDIRAERFDSRIPPRKTPAKPEWKILSCRRCLHLQPFVPPPRKVICAACGRKRARALGMCKSCYDRFRSGTIPDPAWRPDEECTLCGADGWA